MAVKITTKQQFEILIENMVAYPNVARGVRLFGETKANVDEVWRGIADNLNSFGPPTRTPGEWQRVWIHFKAKLKKKMADNKKSRNITGGGPSQEVPLSSLEQTAADLLQINMVVNPEGELCCGVEAVIEETLNEPEQKSSNGNERAKDRHSPIRKRIKPEDQKVGLLKDQTATQAELLKTIQNIEKCINKQNEVMEEIKTLKRKKYELYMEEQELNIRLKRAKLAILERHLRNL